MTDRIDLTDRFDRPIPLRDLDRPAFGAMETVRDEPANDSPTMGELYSGVSTEEPPTPGPPVPSAVPAPSAQMRIVVRHSATESVEVEWDNCVPDPTYFQVVLAAVLPDWRKSSGDHH